MIPEEKLIPFITESNLIEGIIRTPTNIEITAHQVLLETKFLSVGLLREFVQLVAGAPLRNRPGMDVRVGNHLPPRGGPEIESMLKSVLERADLETSPYTVHQAYENLHPFMDGNGRSGRAIWLWQMTNQVRDSYVLERKFLHTWYYQSLSAARQPV